jgi:ribosomal-protein-alanine acetyltransferase
MTTRHATQQDIPAIMGLEKRAPEGTHWSEQAYEAAFDPGAPERVLLVTEIRKTPRAFLIARFTASECEIENIVVAPQNRRCGLATHLMEWLVAAARKRGAEKILLEVRESNAGARALYLRLGFKETGRRKAYYANPTEDAILKALQL